MERNSGPTGREATRKKRSDLVSLGGKLVLHGNHLHEVHPLMPPVLKKSDGGVQAQVPQAALVQQTNAHILDIPGSHAIINLQSTQLLNHLGKHRMKCKVDLSVTTL